MNYRIIPINYGNLEGVVQVHLQAFPNFFLSFLGPRFLRIFYESFIVNPNGIGLVAISPDGQVLGSVVGPVYPQGYFKSLLRKRLLGFAFASSLAVLRKPTITKRLIRAVFYRGQPPTDDIPRSLLSSISVHPSATGQGLGKALMEEWMDRIRHYDVKGCYLTTDAENNDYVNAFYTSQGWKRESTYQTPEGRKMHRYIFDFQT